MTAPFRTQHPQAACYSTLAVLVVWFVNLDYRKLIKPDEGRYAEISREMAVERRLGHAAVERHQVLREAAAALLGWRRRFHSLRQHEWAARLWSALTGVLGIALAWYAGTALVRRNQPVCMPRWCSAAA